MTPTSLPVVPLEPPGPTYGASALWLFETFSRASYLQKFGVQAPPYDPTRKTKVWFDTSDPLPDPVSYIVAVKPGNITQISQITLPVPEARQVNLLGAYQYDTWQLIPTVAVIVEMPGGVRVPIDPTMLSSEADAQRIAAEVGGEVSQVAFNQSGFMDDWGTETRRRYLVTVPEGSGIPGWQDWAASFLKFRGGNAPGSWSRRSNGSFAWQASPDPGVIALATQQPASWPVPIRALLPDEQPGGDTPFSHEPQIRRVAPVPTPAPTPSPSLALLATLDEAKLQLLISLAQQLGLLPK